MKLEKIIAIAFLGSIGLAGQSGAADSATTACIHKWAVPGTYTITGNFKGSTASAGARLSRACKIFLQIPGVFSGSKVRKAGGCLLFRFKIQNVDGQFTGRWCNTTGIVPWNGKNIKTVVRRVSRKTYDDVKRNVKTNFNK